MKVEVLLEKNLIKREWNLGCLMAGKYGIEPHQHGVGNRPLP
jgi:hypothetical protein